MCPSFSTSSPTRCTGMRRLARSATTAPRRSSTGNASTTFCAVGCRAAEGGTMVIVGGTFELDPDQREQFLAGRAAMMRRSRAEHGCLEYSFCADPLDLARV